MNRCFNTRLCYFVTVVENNNNNKLLKLNDGWFCELVESSCKNNSSWNNTDVVLQADEVNKIKQKLNMLLMFVTKTTSTGFMRRRLSLQFLRTEQNRNEAEYCKIAYFANAINVVSHFLWIVLRFCLYIK